MNHLIEGLVYVSKTIIFDTHRHGCSLTKKNSHFLFPESSLYSCKLIVDCNTIIYKPKEKDENSNNLRRGKRVMVITQEY